MRPSKLLLLVALAAILASVRSAEAKEDFPDKIEAHLHANGKPPCGVCHQYGKTGGDTLVTPFALAMRARGLTGESTLIAALDRIGSDHVDSDGDGQTDVDELTLGSDPNSAASTPTAPGVVADPQLGCTVARGGSDGGAALVAPLAAMLAWRWRRRPPPPRPSRRRARRF